MRYDSSGLIGTMVATIDHCIAEIWNPSTVAHLYLELFEISKAAAGGADVPIVRRTSAKGTSGATVTPGAGSEREQDKAPPSGFTLELGPFSVQPTLVASVGRSFVVPASIGSGLMFVFEGDGLQIPPGQGVAFLQASALAFPVGRVGASIRDN